MTPYQRVLHGRRYISEAYYYGGAETALNAVADVAHDLAPTVARGDLIHHYAWDALQEVSEHIQLVATFGQDAVQEAIASGPRAYARFVASLEMSASVGSVAA